MPTSDPLDLFRETIGMSSAHGSWPQFVGEARIRQLRKGETLIRAGERVDHSYFCAQGLFRMFYTLEDGKEYNKSFAAERDFVTSYGALITREPFLFFHTGLGRFGCHRGAVPPPAASHGTRSRMGTGRSPSRGTVVFRKKKNGNGNCFIRTRANATGLFWPVIPVSRTGCRSTISLRTWAFRRFP